MQARLVALAAAATLLVGASANAAVNLLVNPGFEDVAVVGPDISTNGSGWSGWNNWTAPYTAFITKAVAHSGAQCGKTYSGPNAGIYQAVAATPGQQFEASAYFDRRSADAINGTITLDVRLTFKDAAGNNVAAPFISPQLVASSMALDTWTQATVTATAPAGTTQVQFMMFMNNPGNGGGAMYADDASLTVVPEPTALSLIGLSALGLMRFRRKH